MANAPSQAADRVGPFAAGSTKSDLIGLADQENLGLSVVDADEQKRDPHRQRFDGLKAGAREFFFDYEGSSSLVFQKTVDSEHIPDFIQLAYCWLVQDRLGGLILSGVSGDAGTKEHVDQQEASFWAEATEIAEALASKYVQSNQSVLNYFNFAVYPVLPRDPGIATPARVFSSFPRLVTSEEDHETRTRIETCYWGPTVLLASDQKLEPEVATAAAHTSQAVRRIFSNEQWFVVVNHAVERYVRTIESLHVFTKLIYLSRQVMDDLGRKLNAERGFQVVADAQRTIERWEESLRKAEQAKQARIARLSRIL
jgi:hypothetical protein